MSDEVLTRHMITNKNNNNELKIKGTAPNINMLRCIYIQI